MEYSQVDGGKLKLEYKIFKINKLLEDIKDLFSYEIQRKGLDFSLKIHTDSSSYYFFDQERLRQILINLVGNAIKFTKKGKIEIHLIENMLKSKKKEYSNIVYQDKDFIFCGEKEVKILVKDTGIGIPKDQIKKIFFPFEQVEGQSFEAYGGTGLGLSITKGLVEALNGKVNVKSKIMEGSTFEIVFKNIEEFQYSNKEDMEDSSNKELTNENIYIKESNIGLLINSEWDKNFIEEIFTKFRFKSSFF